MVVEHVTEIITGIVVMIVARIVVMTDEGTRINHPLTIVEETTETITTG